MTAHGATPESLERARERARLRVAKGMKENPSYLRDQKYKVDCMAMWVAQSGLCALCGEPMAPFGSEKNGASVDHDHACCDHPGSCGKCVRAILHMRCNRIVGHARDSEDLLTKAILYLRKYKKPADG